MTRYVNRLIETKVQVLNADNTPALGATVTAIVRGIDDSVWDTVVMTEVANGIYTTAWTPDESGHWTVECVCGSPVFRHTFEYFIEEVLELKTCSEPSWDSYTLLDNTDEQTAINLLYPTNADITKWTVWIYPNSSGDRPLPQSITIRAVLNGISKPILVRRFPDDFGAEVSCAIISFTVNSLLGQVNITLQSDVVQGRAIQFNITTSAEISASKLDKPVTVEENPDP
jgi:hypothetical protein